MPFYHTNDRINFSFYERLRSRSAIQIKTVAVLQYFYVFFSLRFIVISSPFRGVVLIKRIGNFFSPRLMINISS